MSFPRIVHMTTVHSAVDHRIFRKECRSLARAGFDVTVIGPHAADALYEQVRICAVQPDQSRFLRMTRTVWRVYCEAVRHDADIYHFHDPELIPAGLLLRRRGKEVVYDIHEDYPKDILLKKYLPGWMRRVIARLADRIETSASKHFSAVVAVTPAIAARFVPINSRTAILHNYPLAEEFGGADMPPWDRRRQSVAYVGTITMQRGIAEMIDAMARLPESLKATLEIAGDAIPGEIILNGAKPRIRHHGALSQPKTYQLLQNVRAGIVCVHPIPTFKDSMPVKIFEYMGAGLPIIASDFSLWRSMLDGVGCALFVNPLDSSQIADSIEYLLTHPREAEEMGRRGHAAVVSRFNWAMESKKLIALYSSLVDIPCVA